MLNKSTDFVSRSSKQRDINKSKCLANSLSFGVFVKEEYVKHEDILLSNTAFMLELVSSDVSCLGHFCVNKQPDKI